MSRHAHYLEPITKDAAQGLVARVYAQLARDLGAVPEPFTLHSPAPRVLAGVWAAFREVLIAAGTVCRGTKEAIAAAISDLNRCPWCVDAHSGMLYATGNADLAGAINGGAEGVQTEMQKIIEWARATRTPGAQILHDPPFSSDAAPEYIGTAIVFHYLTRMVTVMLSETFLPGNRLLKGTLLRIGGWMFADSARKHYEPGASLTLLSDAPRSNTAVWSVGAPHIADAFSALTAIVEEAGERVLSQDTRARVRTCVADWDGGDSGISRRWVDDAVGLFVTFDDAVDTKLAILRSLASE